MFPGGCVTYSFGSAAGPPVALMEQLEKTTGLDLRQLLRLVPQREPGMGLSP